MFKATVSVHQSPMMSITLMADINSIFHPRLILNCTKAFPFGWLNPSSRVKSAELLLYACYICNFKFEKCRNEVEQHYAYKFMVVILVKSCSTNTRRRRLLQHELTNLFLCTSNKSAVTQESDSSVTDAQFRAEQLKVSHCRSIWFIFT